MDDRESKLYKLNLRRTACLVALQMMLENDPAAKEQKALLAELDRSIEEIAGKPLPVVVGLKAASLTAKRG